MSDFSKMIGETIGNCVLLKHEPKKRVRMRFWVRCLNCSNELYREGTGLKRIKYCKKCKPLSDPKLNRNIGEVTRGARTRIRANKLHESRVGNVYNNLKVLEYLGYLSNNSGSPALFLCQCICRKKIVRDAYLVSSGKTSSCGCLAIFQKKERTKICAGDVELSYNMIKKGGYKIKEVAEQFNISQRSLRRRIKAWLEESEKQVI